MPLLQPPSRPTRKALRRPFWYTACHICCEKKHFWYTACQINITENHLDNLSALFFGQALDQMGQKCRYLAKNASFGRNCSLQNNTREYFLRTALAKNLERTNKASWQRTNPMQFLLRMFWFKMKNDRILQISTKWSSGPASSFGCAQIQILAESTH